MLYQKVATPEVIAHQLKAYNLMRSNQPSKIKGIDETTLEYQWVEGKHPTHWQPVWDAAKLAMWDTGISTVTNDKRFMYCRYVNDVAEKYRVPSEQTVRAFVCIIQSHLTPVRMTHGDLTFANVIETGLGMTFIDPGNDRGLCCREIDEAKILQSMDGFDCAYRNWEPPRWQPAFPSRRVHIALLITHYIRMLRHVNPTGCEFARQRIEQLNRSMI